MKPSLQLNVSQQLTLTPQLQQAIRLLQLSTLDLNIEIQEALENNPLLEIEENQTTEKPQCPEEILRESNSANDEIEHTDPLPELAFRDLAASASRGSGSMEDNPNYENFYATTQTLQDYLLWQMSLTPFTPRDQAIAMAIIDAINDDGFLTMPIDDIFTSLQKDELNADPLELDEVLAVLHRVQRFDPVGCGASNLSECLLLQLERLSDDIPNLDAARRIVQSHIDWLATHNYRALMKKCKLSEEALGDVIKLIQTLNPKPGASISPLRTEYVIPDVVVTKVNNEWLVELNPEALPSLKINPHYAGMAQSAKTRSDSSFIKTHLQEARWFLKSIQSRQDTLLRVSKQIVEYQRDFLEYGEEAMKPLVLHAVAEQLELHESTISRVTTQKFLHTPRGVFELKYFFSSHVNTNSGGECSSTAIRAFIKKLIAAENPKKPLSDNKISQLIGEQGIQVARRTIAKYRESLHIPPSNERKSLTN